MSKARNKTFPRLHDAEARKASAIESNVIADNVALVQCWECGYDHYQQFGIGRPEEIRCRLCRGHVEVLTVNGSTLS